MHTFPAHAHLEALFQSAELALVPMMLVYRAIAIPPTRVRKVSPDASLEEAFAS